MSYFSDCLEKFEKLPEDFKNQFGSIEVFEKIELIEEDYGVDLKFLVVLIAIGEIALEDITEYLQKKHELAEEDAYEIRDLLVSKIFKNAENSDLLKEGNSSKVLSSEELIIFFREGISSVLSSDSDINEDIISINKSIFFWLAKDGLFQDVLAKNLLNNQEILTGARIIIDERNSSPTISNWIKDFIIFHGSENFNDIVLAEYLVNSKNIKVLSAEEKDKIKRVLKIYRNLIFFPDSMQDNVESWLFIPVNINSNDSMTSSQDSKRDFKGEDGEVVSSSPEFIDFSEKSSEITVPNIATSAPAKPDLAAELEIMLKDYPENSLEYKTIKQELKRLQAMTTSGK